jgi:hypothetical protein
MSAAYLYKYPQKDRTQLARVVLDELALYLQFLHLQEVTHDLTRRRMGEGENVSERRRECEKGRM